MEKLAGIQNDKTSKDPKTTKVASKKARQACTACQQLKMRCIKLDEQGPCLRCSKTGKECLLRERSVRQSWVKKQESQITQLRNRLNEVEGLIGNKEARYDSSVQIHSDLGKESDMILSIYPNVLGSKNDDDRASYMLESINIFGSIPMTLERLLHPQSWLPA